MVNHLPSNVLIFLSSTTLQSLAVNFLAFNKQFKI